MSKKLTVKAGNSEKRGFFMVKEGDLPLYSEIINVEKKYNYQQGSGYFKQVIYADGNFRQFDWNTLELIGSTYTADQKYLPSME